MPRRRIPILIVALFPSRSPRYTYDDRALESRFLTEVMGRTRLRPDIPINLTPAIKDEALALRNKLLLYRLRNRHAVRLKSEAVLGEVAPRINQILAPLLSVVDDPTTWEALAGFAKGVHEGIVAERGLTTEAELLEVVRELAEAQDGPVLGVREITGRFAERFGREYERIITPRWIGTLLRRRLHLAPYKSNGRYVMPVATASLAALYDRYGISDAGGQGAAEPEPGGHREMGREME